MKRRVILYFMMVILLTIVFVEAVFLIYVQRFYYSGTAKAIIDHAKTSSAFITEDEKNQSLYTQADEILSKAKFKGTELEIVDLKGNVILSTSGFIESDKLPINEVLFSNKPEYHLIKSDKTGEHIMNVQYPIKKQGQIYGILNYETSLNAVNKVIFYLSFTAILYGIIICLIVLFISTKLANSIVDPINKIISVSKDMAKGDFDNRINENYKNELGDLAKTLNYMADEIVKTDRLKSEFISSISHELRTPLTGIKGWSETLQSDKGFLSEEDKKQGLKIISDETNRLISLVEDLLDFSKLSADREIVLFPDEFRLDHLLLQAMMQMRVKAEEKGCSIQMEENNPCTIFADEGRLKQVFINVIDNAIKYSHENGKITIHMTEEKDTVSIRVKDEGIGIDKRHLPLLTKTFYQVDPNKFGTGIGLAVTEQIVSLHKGELKIDSTPGKGTTVTIKLPKNYKKGK
ncbi:sensor histidine kinase [Fictibacillus gelatini]|uniref:sensor histidine kinase n=1 Tax=Fictibacillus gelatini TaxID=225985 RepID=UPI0003F91B01|nr:HAMP domain-containing sensor histidine kinase [Fictibacillus gelatini]